MNKSYFTFYIFFFFISLTPMERPHKMSKIASDMYGWAKESADALKYHYGAQPSAKPMLGAYAISNLLILLGVYNNPGILTMLLQTVGIGSYFYYVSQTLKRTRAERMIINLDLIFESRQGHEDSVKMLLRQGADINARDGAERTALHWASRMGNVRLAQFLQYKGADLEAKTISGFTPLYLLTAENENNYRIAALRWLISQRVDVNTREIQTEIPVLVCAARYGNFHEVVLLCAAGANTTMSLVHMVSPKETEIIEYLLYEGARIRKIDGCESCELYCMQGFHTIRDTFANRRPALPARARQILLDEARDSKNIFNTLCKRELGKK